VGLLATTLLVGCGGGDGVAPVPRADFVGEMAERYATGEAEATCIADYVYDEYDRGEIRVLYDDGVQALPQARWDAFLQSVIGCTVPEGSLTP
jgi:hypothetical protein